MVVDGICKQTFKSIDDLTVKRNIWLIESFVLLAFSFLYYLFDHVPYVLFLLTAVTYFVSQHLTPKITAACNDCSSLTQCSCKVPGNVSFRSPLGKPMRNALNRRRTTSNIPNVLIFDSEHISKKRTPVAQRNGGVPEKVTPFDTF